MADTYFDGKVWRYTKDKSLVNPADDTSSALRPPGYKNDRPLTGAEIAQVQNIPQGSTWEQTYPTPPIVKPPTIAPPAIPTPVPTPAPTTPVGTTIANPPAEVNPYEDPTGEKRKKFIESQQAGIRKATDVVTSSVNPYMKGNIGASLLRDVQAPAMSALAEYELGQQGKATEWQAGATDRANAELDKQIELLRPIIEGGQATAEQKALYNQLINKRFKMGGTGAIIGQPVPPVGGGVPPMPGTPPSTGIDWTTGGKNTAAIQAQIDAIKGQVGTGNTAVDTQYNSLMNQLLGTTGIDYVPKKSPTEQGQDYAKQHATEIARTEADYEGALTNAASVINNPNQYIGTKELTNDPKVVANINEAYRLLTADIAKAKTIGAKIDSGVVTEAEMNELKAIMAKWAESPTEIGQTYGKLAKSVSGMA